MYSKCHICFSNSFSSYQAITMVFILILFLLPSWHINAMRCIFALKFTRAEKHWTALLITESQSEHHFQLSLAEYYSQSISITIMQGKDSISSIFLKQLFYTRFCYKCTFHSTQIIINALKKGSVSCIPRLRNDSVSLSVRIR